MFLEFLLCWTWFLQILPSCSFFVVVFCFFHVCLGPFLASNVSCILFFFPPCSCSRFLFHLFAEFGVPYLVHKCFVCFFVTDLSFSYLKSQCLYLQHSSYLWTFVSLCMVSIDSFRILFIFVVFGSLSFKAWNMFLNSDWTEGTDFSDAIGSNLSGFCFGIFFSLVNFLFICTLALTILWSQPISILVITLKFCMIFLSESFMKSVWFLDTSLELLVSSICLLPFARMNYLFLDYFLHQNLVVFLIFHFCCLFQKSLYISCCYLYFSLSFGTEVTHDNFTSTGVLVNSFAS